MSKIAVIGPRDAILAFRALGADIFPANDAQSALAQVQKTADEDYQIVFLTEGLAAEIAGPLQELQSRVKATFTVITVIPGNRDNLGLGLLRIKQRVEKAIGVDILFKGG
jgi:V/A-type H+-transporting ATPase subunit F